MLNMGRLLCQNLILSWSQVGIIPLRTRRCSIRSHTFHPLSVAGSPGLSSHTLVSLLDCLSHLLLCLFTSGTSSGGASKSVKFCASDCDPNVRSCMSFTKLVNCLSVVMLSVMSCGMSCALSHSVFCICFSSIFKSRRGHCSLSIALSLSQSLLDQSGRFAEGVGCRIDSTCTLHEFSYKVAWGWV